DDHVGKLDQRFVWIGWFFVKRIEPIAAQATRSKSVTERYAVDEIGLRYIDQESARFDERKLALADEIECCRTARSMQAHAVGSRKQFFERKITRLVLSFDVRRQSSPLPINDPHA